METPYITHLTIEDYEHVYEPAEDSFLMIDALENELDFIRELNPTICVEIGSGSGINITAISNCLKSNCYFMATDINPYATKVTKRTAEVNKSHVDPIQMDLLNSFHENSIDLLIFNPPYVPTTSIDKSTSNSSYDEINFKETNIDKNLIKSWAGGKDGREVMNRVLYNLDKILTKNGVFYLLVLKENKLSEIFQIIKEKNFKSKILLDRQIRGEHLYIIKIY